MVRSQSPLDFQSTSLAILAPIPPPLKVNDAPFSELYELCEELGSGQFAVVYKVTCRRSGEKCAAKFIKKRRYATSRRGVPRSHIEREVEVLRAVGGHENVIELKDVFETPTDIILVLELVSGGELFDHVCAHEHLDEAEASAFIRQILLGLRHLHSRFVVHLDIKPENIMLKKRGESKVKLIDFGLSRYIYPGVPVKDMIGTPEFVAPEVVNYEPLSPATDMWAVGVVTFILLSGGSPFIGRTRDETFCNITSVNYHFSPTYFASTSQLARDFIGRLFVKDVGLRASVDDCLTHPWIRGPDFGLDLRVGATISVAKIHGFKVRMRWRRAMEVVRVCRAITRRVREELKAVEGHSYSIDTKYDKDDLITSAILVACEEGNLVALEQLVSVHRLNLCVFNEHGETPVHVAAGGGFDAIVRFLVGRGGFVNATDRRGDTPLFWAARNGHADMIHLLASFAVTVNAKNKNCETALHVATRYAQVTSAIALLERGAQLDDADEHGETPLHIASWHGYHSLLSIMCRFGPTLDLKNADDETALHCAAARGHIECVQCLVETNANVDSQDQNGQTALHLALRRSHVDIALYLISKECNLNIRDASNDTPLHIACRMGLTSVVDMLCHLGADLNCANGHGDMPLHIAAKEGHIDIARSLCFVGANTQVKNRDGLTPEIVAITKEQQQIAQMLAKVKVETSRSEFVAQLCASETPLRRIKLKVFGASQSGKTKLIQALQDSGVIGNLISAVSKRFSDHTLPSGSAKVASDEGIHSCASSSSASADGAGERHWPLHYHRPTHTAYTRGIDVQVLTLPSGDEFSVWEFGGYAPYHISYDHFVGNIECIHVITVRADDPTEVQYRSVLYWMNFLKGRVTPKEPIGHGGIVARRSKVVVVGTHATQQFMTTLDKTPEGFCTNTDAEAMLKTVRLRFESHFDVFEKLIFVDSVNSACPGLKLFKSYLHSTREEILNRGFRPLAMLESCINYIGLLRKRYQSFPVITWIHFTTLLRDDVNPLASDAHCQQIIHQLQLIGEVVYLRDEAAELDYVVITPDWLGTHVLGTLLSADFLSHCRESGCYSAEDFASTFPEISEPIDLINILDTLHLCSPLDPMDGEASAVYEFPSFIMTEPPKDVWNKDKSDYVYGGMRILPTRGMESTLQSTFPRIQVAMRNQTHEYRDPGEVLLQQWQGVSKMTSNNIEALVRLNGDAVEVLVRGPNKLASSCIYFLEDVANVIEQTTVEMAPGMWLERHFLSPKHLRNHEKHPASFSPEAIMTMQQHESLSAVSSDGEKELFTDVVCFGSQEVATMLMLGIDMSVSQLSTPSRVELAALLDPPDAMGRDWSILAVRLSLTEALPEVDSSGISVSQTDQLISEWSVKCPQQASVGKLCAILEEMGRADARDALYRTVPLYTFAPLDEVLGGVTQSPRGSQRDTATSIADSGVLLSSAPRSSSTLSN